MEDITIAIVHYHRNNLFSSSKIQVVTFSVLTHALISFLTPLPPKKKNIFWIPSQRHPFH